VWKKLILLFMRKFLESLDFVRLSHLESSQLMRRHFDDIASLDQSLLTDERVETYLQQLKTKHAEFNLALVQVRKNEETERIEVLDETRDRAFSVLKRAVKLSTLSDTDAECIAAESLQTLLYAYRKTDRLNYEAETIAIDNLIRDLEGEKYASKVTLLSLKKYVTRLKTANTEFKALFGERIQTIASDVTYDAKMLRNEMAGQYAEFTDYIVAMSQALDTPEYNLLLNLINTARKYYADMLSKRLATRDSVV
jgi:hypothetical protein